jgi:hypothetical protein
MKDIDKNTDAIIKLLLDDARLVIGYAVRVGRLPDDKLQTAVYELESAMPGSKGQNLTVLTETLNNAIKAIAPMTLIDLRSGRNPFDPRNQRFVKFLQALFCVVTITLTLIVAHMTDNLNRLDTALKGIHQIQESRPFEKMIALHKMVKFDEVLSKQDSISFDQYHRSISELRDLQDKFNGFVDMLSLAFDVSLLPSWLNDILSKLVQTYFPGDKDQNVYQEALKNANVLYPSTDQYSDRCSPKVSQNKMDELNSQWPYHQQALDSSVEESCFFKKLNLKINPMTPSMLYEVQVKITILNGWVLPFMYGLLGAVVFVMRNLLDPRTPLMGLFPSIVRVLLGGLAGILIGWFWVPSAFKVGDSANITSIPFGLAFLAGFSIDILFTILDRISRTISEPAAQKTS